MIECTIIAQSGRWQPEGLEIEAVLTRVLSYLGVDEDRAVAVVLSDDAQIQALNRDYRGQNKPTNVLSFPSDAPDEWGDLMFAYETIAAEAVEQGKAFAAHFTHLLVHGMLHLLGYDHLEEAEAEAMEALEIAILGQLGVANPYESS